jgi:hypothetical protein
VRGLGWPAIALLVAGACTFAWDDYDPRNDNGSGGDTSSSSGAETTVASGGAGGAPGTGGGTATSTGGAGGALVDPIEACVEACLFFSQCSMVQYGGAVGSGGAGGSVDPRIVCMEECALLGRMCSDAEMQAFAACFAALTDCTEVDQAASCVLAIPCFGGL